MPSYISRVLVVDVFQFSGDKDTYPEWFNDLLVEGSVYINEPFSSFIEAIWSSGYLEAFEGDWVVRYPNGDVQVFNNYEGKFEFYFEKL